MLGLFSPQVGANWNISGTRFAPQTYNSERGGTGESLCFLVGSGRDKRFERGAGTVGDRSVAGKCKGPNVAR